VLGIQAGLSVSAPFSSQSRMAGSWSRVVEREIRLGNVVRSCSWPQRVAVLVGGGTEGGLLDVAVRACFLFVIGGIPVSIELGGGSGGGLLAGSL
jgi:hypothetical protein